MNRLVLFILNICLALNCFGQSIDKCDVLATDTFRCDNVTIKRMQRVNNSGVKVTGFLSGKTFVPALVCILNGDLVFTFGNEFSKGARMDVDCSTIKNGNIVNGYKNRLREGLWLNKTLSGRVKKITLYAEGQRLKELYFWSNGQPRQLILYLNGKRRISGARMYNKEGVASGGPM